MSESVENAADEQAPVEGQVACSMTSTLLRRTRGTHGQQAVEEVIARAEVNHSSDFLEDIGNWIWYGEAVRLFEAAEEILGDEHIGRRVGEDALRQHAGTPVATLLRSLGSPEAVFEQVTRAVAKFTTVTDMETLELEPGHATIRARARPGYRRHRHMCEYAMGILSQCTCLFGLPIADVDEVCCELRGDDYCLYEVSWDAEGAASAADPQELITSLEAQVAAMASRLESMYATARDLIASHDLDAALARITERAATAVRAPKYLLAVRTGNDLRVHHRGFSEEDCRHVAEALIEGKGLDHALGRDESRLIAEVASTTKRYGRIMAASPAGSFFPHERELLEVYARYAAAVLDTATALADARRRHEQSRALLELARELVRARTGEEVARRAADAVTRLIDCDWVSVFLWDEDDGVLRCAATAGAEPPVEERLRMLAIDPAESALLAAVLANPVAEPIYVDRSTTDPFVVQAMPLTGSRGTVALPIVANDRFYGSVNVSATERPERLRAPAVADVLVGVAAQTATALDNAWLIEAMSHQARHDNLTGLLGHRAFHEALRHAVESGENEQLTLALLDLDDFKLINDEHGHMVGDEALKSVAQTLRATVREPDRLFRIGGEEFALLMPGLDRDDAVGVAERLREAVAGARFRLPLRVSIGLASWPQDADDRHRLFELADQALYAAKRDGKDRTRVAAAA